MVHYFAVVLRQGFPAARIEGLGSGAGRTISTTTFRLDLFGARNWRGQGWKLAQRRLLFSLVTVVSGIGETVGSKVARASEGGSCECPSASEQLGDSSALTLRTKRPNESLIELLGGTPMPCSPLPSTTSAWKHCRMGWNPKSRLGRYNLKLEVSRCLRAWKGNSMNRW